jgi:hypothetical protein
MTKRRGEHRGHFICPCCGAEVPVGAKSCRECGASDDSGWGDDAAQDDQSSTGYGPDDDFDYDEFVSREFPDQSPADPKKQLKQWALAVLVVIVIIAFLAAMVFPG